MLTTDEVIILSAKKYIQSKYIIHALSKKNGKTNFIAYPNLAKQGGFSFLAPLSHIEITYSEKGHAIPIIKDYSWLFVPKYSQNDIRKQCITIFISEIIENTLIHPLQEDKIFMFITSYIEQIEKSTTLCNIPIQFLIDLSELLGISFLSYEHLLNTQKYSTKTRRDRQLYLHALCDYYMTQIEYFKIPKSLSVVEEILDATLSPSNNTP